MLNTLQTSPLLGDIGSLMEAGVAIIGGETVATEKITDSSGNDISAASLKEGDDPAAKFLCCAMGTAGRGGELLLRKHDGTKGDFIHTVKAIKTGKMVYSCKSRTAQFQLESEMATAERCAISARELGGEKTVVSILPETTKSCKFSFSASKEREGDRFSFTFKNLIVGEKRGLVVGIGPGTASLDLLGAEAGGQALLEIESHTSGRDSKAVFKVDCSKATRLDFRKFAGEKQLKAVAIREVHGEPAGKGIVLKPLA
jgi:hypothetical protein